MPSIPKYADIKHIFESSDVCLEWLIENGVLNTWTHCRCGAMVTRHQKYGLRCSNDLCQDEVSIFKGTLFEGNHIGCHQIMLIAYLMLCGSNRKTIMNMVKITSRPLTNWIGYINQVIRNDMEIVQDVEKIGGPGIIVEIDESKFGKRKYNVGHQVEGVWVVGGVERTPERKMFAVAVQNRNAQTLSAIIDKYVLPETTIYTDGWKGYESEDINAMNIVHETVNHSKNLVDPNTGVHTNTIEGTWSAIKWTAVPLRHRCFKFVDGDLMVFIWKRRFADNLWDRFLHAVRNMEYAAPNVNEPQDLTLDFGNLEI